MDDPTGIEGKRETIPTVVAIWTGGMQSRPLTDTPVTVGRSSSCNIQVPLPSVSRVHLEIHAGPPVSVVDLGSTHGTTIDGRRIAPNTPCTVGASSLIEVGEVTVLVKGLAPITQATTTTKSPMERLDDLLTLVSRSDISVILLGETGVGKGKTAADIHARSRRAKAPFLPISCAALPEPMLEGELFGYERGAFTGATTARAGLLESAEGGTVFLDEIGELPMATQVKLLRVVEDREVLRLGDRRPRSIDVRFISATHRDLEKEIAAGRFREDLYYRLNGLAVELPPLRNRRDEIPALASAFLAEAGARARRGPFSFDPDAMKTLIAHEWPGNVRELKNVIDRSVVLVEGLVIHSEALFFGGKVGAKLEPIRAPRPPEEPSEERAIRDALERAAGNQTRAAKLMGIPLRTFLRRLDEYGIERPRRVTKDE